MKTTHNISMTETLARWIIWIWFLISTVGFLYMVFHIGNYIFTNVGYLVFWAISINTFFATFVCLYYTVEMQKKMEK